MFWTIENLDSELELIFGSLEKENTRTQFLDGTPKLSLFINMSVKVLYHKAHLKVEKVGLRQLDLKDVSPLIPNNS